MDKNNKQTEDKSQSPPPPSYDESQRSLNRTAFPSTSQQPHYASPYQPQPISSTSQTPYHNLPSTSYRPPSAPPMPNLPQIPMVKGLEKHMMKFERKLNKHFDKLDQKFANQTNMNHFDNHCYKQQNKTDRQTCNQQRKIENQIENQQRKIERIVAKQQTKFEREMNKIEQKTLNFQRNLCHKLQPGLCSCKWMDRNVSCGPSCTKYPNQTFTPATPNHPNYDPYYNNSKKC